VEAVARVIAEAESAHEPELAERLDGELRRRGEAATAVVVAGEAKRGKSSLINALLERPVSPVDVDVATSTYLTITHGEPEGAVVHLADGSTVELPLGDLAAWATELGNPQNTKGVRSIDVHLDHELLAGGVTLVDTPGVGGISAAHARVTRAALQWADALLFVLDASAPVSAPELAFLREVTDRVSLVVFAVTKTDQYYGWRQILEDDQERLRAGFPVSPFFAVSAFLEQEAASIGDDELARELRAESGVGLLRARLQEWLSGRAELYRATNVLQLATRTLDRLRERQRAALEGAARNPETDERIAAAKAELDAFEREQKRLSGTELPAELRDVERDVLISWDTRLVEIERRYLDDIRSGRLEPAELPTRLETEFGALHTELVAEMISRVQEFVGELAQQLALAVGALDPEALGVESPTLDVPTLPRMQQPTWVTEGIGAAQQGSWIFRMLTHSAVASAVPFAPYLAPILVIGAFVMRMSAKQRVQNEQRARELLTWEIQGAKAQLAPQVKSALREVSQGIADAVRAAIEARRAELAGVKERYEEYARKEDAEREDARKELQERLGRLDTLAAELAAVRKQVDAARAAAAEAR
jgi:signal recognition particle receptor subunit beta